MGRMNIVIVLLAVVGIFVVAAAAAWGARVAAARSLHDVDPGAGALASAEIGEAIDTAVADALARVHQQATAERDAAVTAALNQAAILQREQLGALTTAERQHSAAELAGKKDIIDARLDQVHGEMRAELTRLGEMVANLGRTSAESFGQVTNSLHAHAEIASTLADSTRALREALSNPQTRGQWGERMAEDVLRLAGFQENVNYRKQVQVEGGSGRPDFTFPMPKGHALYMDVKFPMASYLRYLEVGSNAEREVHLKKFLSDVRLRVRELAKRDYANEGSQLSIDYVLLFLPNEQLSGFIHENDPALIDDAMSQKVVLCSPLTLFAFLGVIRQAFDNFMIEQTSDEILKLLGSFGTQWRKYAEQVDTVKKRFDQVDRAFEQLVGPRRRQLERPLRALDELRVERNLPVDGELFAVSDTADETDTPPGGTIRALGA